MTLVSSLKTQFPSAPPANDELRTISNSLGTALNQSIVTAFVPGVFGNVVLSTPGLTEKMIEVYQHLIPLVETVIGSALAAQAVPATAAPPAAWNAVKAQILSWPLAPSLKGDQGIKFWEAIKLTIVNVTPGIPEVNT